jgi:hypothetical protein
LRLRAVAALGSSKGLEIRGGAADPKWGAGRTFEYASRSRSHRTAISLAIFEIWPAWGNHAG